MKLKSQGLFRIIGVLIALSMFLGMGARAFAGTNTLISPGIDCGSRSGSTYSVTLTLPPQYAAAGYEIRHALSGTWYASGYMGYQATATGIPINVPFHARVTDGMGNWSGWSSTIWCYHTSGTYTITLACSEYNSTYQTYTVTASWSPYYYQKETRLYNNYGTTYATHFNGDEGISSPDTFYNVNANTTFNFRIKTFNDDLYLETGKCTGGD